MMSQLSDVPTIVADTITKMLDGFEGTIENVNFDNQILTLCCGEFSKKMEVPTFALESENTKLQIAEALAKEADETVVRYVLLSRGRIRKNEIDPATVEKLWGQSPPEDIYAVFIAAVDISGETFSKCFPFMLDENKKPLRIETTDITPMSVTEKVKETPGVLKQAIEKIGGLSRTRVLN
jgi:hypothetical protein